MIIFIHLYWQFLPSLSPSSLNYLPTIFSLLAAKKTVRPGSFFLFWIVCEAHFLKTLCNKKSTAICSFGCRFAITRRLIMISKGGIRKSVLIFRPHDSIYRFIYILCINLLILSNFRSKLLHFATNLIAPHLYCIDFQFYVIWLV